MLPTSNKLEIIDPETGIVKEVPINEFVVHNYKEAMIQGREKEIDVISIIRAIHQKSRLRKKSHIKLRIDNSETDVEISALALATLHMYSQDEINDLITADEFETTYCAALPNDIQPSTSKQRAFALAIANSLNIDLGYEILASKRQISTFITEYQNEHENYASDIEGVEFISARLEDALIQYFLKKESWDTLFNTAFELYLQASQRYRKIILEKLSGGISDSYWNKDLDLPEGIVACQIISEMSFNLKSARTHAEKFKAFHDK